MGADDIVVDNFGLITVVVVTGAECSTGAPQTVHTRPPWLVGLKGRKFFVHHNRHAADTPYDAPGKLSAWIAGGYGW